eukprot:COSAG06_NODE_544_length_14458_cov_18.391671_2_plen_52_part_00
MSGRTGSALEDSVGGIEQTTASPMASSGGSNGSSSMMTPTKPDKMLIDRKE